MKKFSREVWRKRARNVPTKIITDYRDAKTNFHSHGYAQSEKPEMTPGTVSSLNVKQTHKCMNFEGTF
jgi:hypothetical protein